MKYELYDKFAKLTYEPEKDGRIFFCTDIHGKYDILINSLKQLGFINNPYPNEKADKLICLGDMGDRGEQSFDVLSAFKNNPNYFPIKGNHDQLIIDGTKAVPFISKINKMALTRDHLKNKWIDQGGSWHLNHDFYAIKNIGEWVDTLPMAAQLEIGDHKIGLTHSSVISNELFKKTHNRSMSSNKTSGDETISFTNKKPRWSNTVTVASAFSNIDDLSVKYNLERAIMFDRTPFRQQMEVYVDGVDAVLHGHTLTPHPKVLGNSIYFETGAFLIGKEDNTYLTILEYLPGDGELLGMFKAHRFY